ncbi:ribosomal-protein-alanine N-acetyltransferase [Psychrobacillus psychrotolerans]|uniref:Ribosomal-protein-alanine N-acetyltransferase n=1 Tax=Psychrobacillus psychrotolerans TaxID=126156 RepID=A0A1I6ANK3_9BACI|nr:GNAT family protein [Psychrobacillus psychrotolerans]SFQ70226.1 ribosomal-protein-alanine N-acetyltransferase [Psychrobacillus psychrotolerans]
MIYLEGDTCYLRTLNTKDAPALADLTYRNKMYWSVYEPLHRDDYYTTSVQREKIRESLMLSKEKREYSFGIFEHQSDKMIGSVSLYSIKRMPFSSGLIGYSMDESNIGKGIASEAVHLVKVFGFEHVQLNRIEAYVSPNNPGSIKVLEKNGFNQEGLLRKLLYINGKWQDHFIYASLTEEDI